jgi:hypothetical protein
MGSVSEPADWHAARTRAASASRHQFGITVGEIRYIVLSIETGAVPGSILVDGYTGEGHASYEVNHITGQSRLDADEPTLAKAMRGAGHFVPVTSFQTSLGKPRRAMVERPSVAEHDLGQFDPEKFQIVWQAFAGAKGAGQPRLALDMNGITVELDDLQIFILWSFVSFPADEVSPSSAQNRLGTRIGASDWRGPARPPAVSQGDAILAGEIGLHFDQRRELFKQSYISRYVMMASDQTREQIRTILDLCGKSFRVGIDHSKYRQHIRYCHQRIYGSARTAPSIIVPTDAENPQL